MEKSSKFPNSNHPVDHMKYVVLLDELSKSENTKNLDKLFEKIESQPNVRRDRRLSSSALFVEIANVYDDFLQENPGIKESVSNKTLKNRPHILVRAAGMDLDNVSKEFLADLEDVYRFEERLGSESDNYMNPREFLVKNKEKILDLSSQSSDRDIFTGITFGLLHNKNRQVISKINNNGNIVTDFHGFDFNTRELMKNNKVKDIMSIVDDKFLERRNNYINDRNLQKKEKEELAAKVEDDIKSSLSDFTQAAPKEVIPGPHVSDYMKYLLMLNEITKDENEAEFKRYVQGLLSEKSYEDASKITVDQLIGLDFSDNLPLERLSVISNHVPEIRKKVDDYIFQFSSESVLESAGYDVSTLPEHFISDIRTTMAYEASFPEPNSSPMSERLSSVKDEVLSILSSDKSRMGLSAVMVGVSCAFGGAPAIILSAANMASTFLKSDKVVNLLNKGQEKLNNALVSIGVKKETITKKENLIGSKMKAFFENDYVKGTLKVAGIAAATFGVGMIASSMIENGTVSSFANNFSTGLDFVSDEGSKSLSALSDKAGALIDGTTEEFANLADLLRESSENCIINDVSTYASETLDTMVTSGEEFASETSETSEKIDKLVISGEEVVANMESVSVASNYNIEDIMSNLGSTSSLSEVYSANRDVDIHNLLPGDTLEIQTEAGIIEHKIPEINDVIIQSAFPSGIPQYLDSDKFVQMVIDNNESIDFSTGIFGNDNLGSDILKNGDLNLPNINIDELSPLEREVIIDALKHHATNDVNDTLLAIAYPNGIPDLVDRDVVLQDIRNDNPGLDSLISSSKGFEEKIIIGGDNLEQSVASTQQESEGKKLFEKGNGESFIDRVREKNNMDGSTPTI